MTFACAHLPSWSFPWLEKRGRCAAVAGPDGRDPRTGEKYDGRAEIVLEEHRQLGGAGARIPPLAQNYDVEKKGRYSAGTFSRPKAKAEDLQETGSKCDYPGAGGPGKLAPSAAASRRPDGGQRPPVSAQRSLTTINSGGPTPSGQPAGRRCDFSRPSLSSTHPADKTFPARAHRRAPGLRTLNAA